MTLLALLELVRLGQVRARQAELFGDIVIDKPRELIAGRARRDEPVPDERTSPGAMRSPSMTEPVDVLEALLFASDAAARGRAHPGSARLDIAPSRRASWSTRCARRLDAEGRALQFVEVGGGFRLVTRPEVAPWLVKLARSKTTSRLSRPALETLAIVAYRQPVSRPEVDAVRGVNSEGVLDNLLERRMIRIAGRKDSPGRPFLYETDARVPRRLRPARPGRPAQGRRRTRAISGGRRPPPDDAPGTDDRRSTGHPAADTGETGRCRRSASARSWPRRA